MFGISPIKWRQRPDMTIAVSDWGAMPQLKQANIFLLFKKLITFVATLLGHQENMSVQCIPT